MQHRSGIVSASAMQILDSRGNPTISVSVSDGKHRAKAAVPSGASTGKYEALELRDGGKSYGGKSVGRAVNNVNIAIADAIKGLDPEDQSSVDTAMIRLDGTPNKSSLGANAMLGVSMACTRLAAMGRGVELYSYFSEKWGRKPILPTPLMNIINGGVHAGGDLAVQEFLVVPAGFSSFGDALRAADEVYHSLRSGLKAKYGSSAVNIGDEGGFAPPLKTTGEALEAITEAIGAAGYTHGKEVFLAIDAASSEFFREGKYLLDGRSFSPPELLDYYRSLVSDFRLLSIEDPFDEESFDDFAALTASMGSRAQIIGDDLYVTSPSRIRKGIEMRASNAVLIKLNQIGTVSETIESSFMAMDAGFGTVVSHRSGETTDTFIADMAVGISSGQIKTGAPARGERVAKYNRLLEIEAAHPEIRFAGLSPFRREL